MMPEPTPTESRPSQRELSIILTVAFPVLAYVGRLVDQLAQRAAVLDGVTRGDLVLRREIPVEDMHLALRLYDRTSMSHDKAACQ